MCPCSFPFASLFLLPNISNPHTPTQGCVNPVEAEPRQMLPKYGALTGSKIKFLCFYISSFDCSCALPPNFSVLRAINRAISRLVPSILGKGQIIFLLLYKALFGMITFVLFSVVCFMQVIFQSQRLK